MAKRLFFVGSTVLVALFLALTGGATRALGPSLAESEQVRQATASEVKSKIQALLQQYCAASCQLIDVTIDVQEKIPLVQDLGFEGLGPEQPSRSYEAAHLAVSIQIDQNVSQADRDKLERLITQHLSPLGASLHLNLVAIDLPYIGQTASSAQLLKQKAKTALEEAVHSVIQRYCPEECVLTDTAVFGELITPDEADKLQPQEVVRSEREHTALHVTKAELTLAIDEKLPGEERENISKLLRAKTQFISPLSLTVNPTPFPETYAEKELRRTQLSQDPYGLEKLRQMLIMFRELAGTKEIISTTEKENKSSSETSSSSQSSSQEQNLEKWLLYALAGLVVVLIFGLILLRFSQANKDAKVMLHALHEHKTSEAAGGGGGNTARLGSGGQKGQRSEELASLQGIQENLELQSLKEELIQVFISAPKVAKETFTRILQEDGIEEGAKYVYIFGKVVIFELLSDPALQRNLYELSEYFIKSSFAFSIKDQISLMKRLKIKLTANEIKVLAGNTIDQFDFLTKLDTPQIFALMADENPKIQSIILTQIAPQRRRMVFDLFTGKAKMQLMQELCKADAIPREFLQNVAIALGKKVSTKPEFDTQSMRTSDIVLDLLEKASLKDQRSLMQSLSENNAESARVIKLKLVSIETLPFLKDGHLLELVLGLEREDLLTFLGGAAEHIRRLLLAHAPDELAASWAEDLNNMAGVDDNNYRLVEIKVLNKVRQLASTGSINLLEINQLIFGTPRQASAEQTSNGLRIEGRNLVA